MNQVRRVLLASIALVLAPLPASAGLTISLPQAIAMAQKQSTASAIAINRFRASYWEHRTQRTTFLPSLSLHVSAPNFTRTISKITRPDGTEAFVPQSYTNSSVLLSMRKPLGTGGEIFVESELERLDDPDGIDPASYLARPIDVGFRQPLFGYNDYSWENKIEPLRFEEARRDYAEDLENVALSATNAFFDLLGAEDQLASARINVASADTMAQLARVRFQTHKILEDEMLQTELALLNANLALQRAELDLFARSDAFRTVVGLRDSASIELVVRFEVPDVTVDIDHAIQEGRARRSDAVGFERRLLEADRTVDQARGQGYASLYASYGRSTTAYQLDDLLHRAQEHEEATLSLEVPLLDWGRARARRQTAESNRDVTQLSVEQSRADFDREVTTKVTQFNTQRERLRIAARADDIAQRRFDAATTAYVAGHGDATSINLARSEKDNARRAHIDALRGYWVAYYELRRGTLFDFRTNEPLRLGDISE